jgi:hypothetical protein
MARVSAQHVGVSEETLQQTGSKVMEGFYKPVIDTYRVFASADDLLRKKPELRVDRFFERAHRTEALANFRGRSPWVGIAHAASG